MENSEQIRQKADDRPHMYLVDGKVWLRACAHCKGEPMFISKENYSAHTFWRVQCMDCGCGTWCDEDGWGYEDNPGKERAITEWNSCAEQESGLISRRAVIAILEKRRLAYGKRDLAAEYKITDIQEEIEKLPVIEDIIRKA